MKLNKEIKNFIFLHLGLLLGTVAFYLTVFLTRLAVPNIKCPFLDIFHMYCPGCGGTRAVTALLSGQFLDSFLYYPPIIIFAAFIFLYDIYFLMCLKFRRHRLPAFPLWTLYVIVGIIGVWFVLRNILYFAFGFDPLGDLSALSGR